ncbi:hypothetical protein [Ekhidna sp.]|uniref:hypothetical protein n=1 Tax=Ekhidna sp. TaxID=2608089 RepID=UPI003B5D010E
MNKSLLTYSSSTSIFGPLSRSLKTIVNDMDKEEFHDHGPTSIVLLFALIQGYLSQVFIETLRNSEDYRKCQQEKLMIPYRALTDLIINPAYNLRDIKANYKLLDINLAKVDNTNWNAINHLNNIRNLVAHGFPIVYHEMRLRDLDTKELDILGTKFSLEESFKYLKNNNLIDYTFEKENWKPGPDNRFEIFHFKVVKFFVQSCQDFIKKLRATTKISHGMGSDRFINEFVEWDIKS